MSALLLLFLEKFKFRPQTCKKYASKQKKLKTKVVQNFILYKNVRERIYLFPPSWSYGARKIDVVEWLKYFYETQTGMSNNAYKTENKTKHTS